MKKKYLPECSTCEQLDSCAHAAIRVLVVEPEKKPYSTTICSSLRSMQEAVGGPIQAVCDHLLKDKKAVILCHEEGKLLSLRPNRALRDHNGRAVDFICGTFIIAGVDGDGFSSLESRQVSRWKERFWCPEQIVVYASKVVAIPLLEDEA